MGCHHSHKLVSKTDVNISFMDVTSAWGTNVTSKLVYMYRGKMMGGNIGEMNIKSPKVSLPKFFIKTFASIFMDLKSVNVSSLNVDPKLLINIVLVNSLV